MTHFIIVFLIGLGIFVLGYWRGWNERNAEYVEIERLRRRTEERRAAIDKRRPRV